MGGADGMELIYSLTGFPDETEWIEFKEGSSEPLRIAQDISALANSAAYLRRDWAYKIWGVSDAGHELVGTTFNPYRAKGKGNQDLLIWLRSHLSANASYEFRCIQGGNRDFVVLIVAAAQRQPVSFDNVAYIREGASTTRLPAGSAKEALLWRRLQSGGFEGRPAKDDLALDEALQLLSAETYFDLIGIRQPTNADAVMSEFVEQGLACAQDDGRYAVTNLGALTIGKELSVFPGLRKRALRVLRFDGPGSLKIAENRSFDKGYALALPEAERHIMSVLPTEEMAQGAFRRIVPAYPQRAIRELLSNALIHQDLSDATSGPLVAIHEGRVEFSNPGTTLVPTERVLNALPKTRNEALANLMRQMGLCEEGGTGWDLIVGSCEAAHMLAPKMRSEEPMGTLVTLYEGNDYTRMKKSERMDAVYWHTCLLYAEGQAMTNQSLRQRFALGEERKNVVALSRLIRDCCAAGLVKDEDPQAGDRFRRYIPSWA